MRTIKFRAWCEECYDEESDSYVFEMISSDRLAISEYNLLKDQLKQTEKFRLMQFTGLQDKNGKEIYEGDKIKYKNFKGYSTIVFENGAFGYYGISCFITLLETNAEHIEVIGNVFQDSE